MLWKTSCFGVKLGEDFGTMTQLENTLQFGRIQQGPFYRIIAVHGSKIGCRVPERGRLTGQDSPEDGMPTEADGQ